MHCRTKCTCATQGSGLGYIAYEFSRWAKLTLVFSIKPRSPNSNLSPKQRRVAVQKLICSDQLFCHYFSQQTCHPIASPKLRDQETNFFYLCPMLFQTKLTLRFTINHFAWCIDLQNLAIRHTTPIHRFIMTLTWCFCWFIFFQR